MYEASLCTCGQSTLLTLDRRNTGEWEIEEATCEACFVVDLDADRDEPGVKRFLINHIGETEDSAHG